MKTIVDHQASVARVNRMRPVVVARELGCTAQMVSQVLRGNYPRMNSEKAQQILDHYRTLGGLVEVPVTDAVDGSGWGQQRLAA